MKYPIGIQDFVKLRQGGFAYVDKTKFVYKLADEGSYYFLSRPRRFGKSLFCLHSKPISTVEKNSSKDLPYMIWRKNGRVIQFLYRFEYGKFP